MHCHKPVRLSYLKWVFAHFECIIFSQDLQDMILLWISINLSHPSHLFLRTVGDLIMVVVGNHHDDQRHGVGQSDGNLGLHWDVAGTEISFPKQLT